MSETKAAGGVLSAEVREQVAELHKQMDRMGVSHSVYGQAAREGYIRQHMGNLTNPVPAIQVSPGYAQMIAGTAERRFTRAEVLKWLKDRGALLDAAEAPTAARATLSALIHDFERME